jgi:Flp pilus assembly protein TadG
VSRWSQRGQTTVEFALVLPAIFLFLIGIFQVGGAYFDKESLQTAARDGARAASIHTGNTPDEVKAYAKAAIIANASGLNTTQPGPLNIQVDCLPDQLCTQGEVVQITVTYPWKLGVYSFSTSGTLSTVTKLRME